MLASCISDQDNMYSLISFSYKQTQNFDDLYTIKLSLRAQSTGLDSTIYPSRPPGIDSFLHIQLLATVGSMELYMSEKFHLSD